MWNPGPRSSAIEVEVVSGDQSVTRVAPPEAVPETPEVVVPVPELAYPTSGERVTNPLRAAGSAVPFADVRADVRVDGRVVGTARVSANEDGDYLVEIPYSPAPLGAEIVVCVAQVVGDGVSLAATVAVVQGAAPEAPVVDAPADEASVANEITVRGRGERGAMAWAVAVDSQSGEQLGVVAMLPGHDGGFQGQLHLETPPSRVVHLAVFQESSLGTSAPTASTLYYEPQLVRGRIFQASGRSDGRRTYVRVYDDPQSAVHLYETVLETPAEGFVDQPFALSVPRGEYWIRAFRDSTGIDASGFTSGPDGEPTLPDDPQASAVGPIVVDGDVEGVELRLRDVSRAGAPIRSFNVYALNETAESFAPGGGEVSEVGECGGFHLAVEANVERARRYTRPTLVTVDGRERRLEDDGGCGDGLDNRAGSYDRLAGDGVHGLGWQNPTAGDSGRYALAVRHRAMDVLGIAVDDVVVRRLPRLALLHAPRADEASLRVVYAEWEPIPSVGSSRVLLYGPDGLIEASEATDRHAFQATDRVTDDTYYALRFEHYDVDLSENADFDAAAHTAPFGFVVDVDGADTVQVRGHVEAPRTAPGPVMVVAQTEAGPVSALLTEGSGSFALTVPRSERPMTIEAFVDRDLSGSSTSEGNGGAAAHLELPSVLEDVRGVELEIEHRVVIASPRDQEVVSRRPTFAWRGIFGIAPAGEWSYHLRAVRQGSTDERGLSFVFPASVTELDLTRRPVEAYDSGLLMSCEAHGGVVRDGVCSAQDAEPSRVVLPHGSDWVWTVEVVACSQTPRTLADVDGNGQDDFSDCVADALRNQRVLGTSLPSRLRVR